MGDISEHAVCKAHESNPVTLVSSGHTPAKIFVGLRLQKTHN